MHKCVYRDGIFCTNSSKGGACNSCCILCENKYSCSMTCDFVICDYVIKEGEE